MVKSLCEEDAPNRPFAGSGHMVRNKLRWDANDAAGLPKQRKVGLDWYEFLCFGSPTASFASQRNLFRTIPAKGLFETIRCIGYSKSVQYNEKAYSNITCDINIFYLKLQSISNAVSIFVIRFLSFQLNTAVESRQRRYRASQQLGRSESLDKLQMKKMASDILNWTMEEMQLLMHGVFQVSEGQ